MANLMVAERPEKCICFFCGFPIELGEIIYENHGNYAHVTCYKDELVDKADEWQGAD